MNRWISLRSKLLRTKDTFLQTWFVSNTRVHRKYRVFDVVYKAEIFIENQVQAPPCYHSRSSRARLEFCCKITRPQSALCLAWRTKFVYQWRLCQLHIFEKSPFGLSICILTPSRLLISLLLLLTQLLANMYLIFIHPTTIHVQTLDNKTHLYSLHSL